MNQKFSVTLPTEVIDAINGRVEAGTYSSPGEVVAAAMEALAGQDDDYGERIASIRARVKASIEDPRPAISSEEMKVRIDAFIEKHR